MIFARWRARRASLALIDELRGEIVAASRRPALYQALGAPDRVDGRFELLVLHVGLVLRRLTALGGLGDAIAQDLVNAVFLHLDDTLREQALSDIAVSKRLQAMKEAFYGRNAAYAAALDSGSRADLDAALARNVYGAPRGRAEGVRARRLCPERSTRPWTARRSRISPRAGSASRTARSPEVDAAMGRSRSAGPFGSIRCRRTARPLDDRGEPRDEREALAGFPRAPSIEALSATLTVKPAARGGARVTGMVQRRTDPDLRRHARAVPGGGRGGGRRPLRPARRERERRRAPEEPETVSMTGRGRARPDRRRQDRSRRARGGVFRPRPRPLSAQARRRLRAARRAGGRAEAEATPFAVLRGDAKKR